jgi:LPS export ABC transporter permease LptG
MRPRFPNRLDRYIISTLLLVLLMVTLSGVTIYIIADLTDRSDEIFENQVPTDVVLRYYKYRSFQMALEIAPIAVLVTTLIAFGIHSQRNEVTAAKASGVSLYRLAVPAVAVALGVVGLGFALELKVLPASSHVVSELEDQIMGREGARSYRRADRQWLFGQGRYIYNYLHYDDAKQALHRLQVFEFDRQHRLVRRLFTRRAVYQGEGVWLFDGAWSRTFDGLETVEFQLHNQPVTGLFPERPAFFESDVRLPDAMNFGELRQYLQELEDSGQRAPELRVKLHEKWALPAFPLVLGLVALPFSFRLGRRGALYGVGIGIVLGIVFFGLYALFSTLGETGVLPPLVAVWSPGLIFAVLSLYLFLGIRS